MAMLAEKRSKVKYILNPRSNQWSKDESKFGHRLMEKMGWKPGNGLGVNQQGSTEHVKVTVRSDNRGVGFKGRPEDVLPHQNEFSDLLEQLSTSLDQPAASSKSCSLEEKSQRSRARVHYHKATRGKDLTRYSQQDLACILGKPTSQSSEQFIDQDTLEQLEEVDDLPTDGMRESDNCSSDSGDNVPDKSSKKKTKKNIKDVYSDGIVDDIIMTKKDKKREKGKRVEVETATEAKGLDSKKQKKKKKLESAEIEVETADFERKKRKNSAGLEIANETEGSDYKKSEEEVDEVKKRKKRKQNIELENVVETEEETEGATHKKKKRKKKHVEEEEMMLEIAQKTDVEIEDSECKAEKKRKKAEVKIETTAESEIETKSTDSEKQKKKKHAVDAKVKVAEEANAEVEESEFTTQKKKNQAEGKTKRRKSVTFSEELFQVVIIPQREEFDEDEDEDDEMTLICQTEADDMVLHDGVNFVNGLRVGSKPNGRQTIGPIAAGRTNNIGRYNLDEVFEGFPGSNVAQLGYSGLEY